MNPSKDKSKKLKGRLLQVLFGALRVNVVFYSFSVTELNIYSAASSRFYVPSTNQVNVDNYFNHTSTP